ncbi:BTB/POZ domain-containing protein POB1 [Acorus calamus]|uniref:BTB/POZ domain-containing protein POB1 n=1 Tax=Acorus calamus TaxID=4465 RepID=A0AAV9F8M0_ACOCL|nr:BTB/POZ domain-containing protein POB1 [Acorus calamus]
MRGWCPRGLTCFTLRRFIAPSSVADYKFEVNCVDDSGLPDLPSLRRTNPAQPCKHCVMYFDLMWEECVGLALSGRMYSEAFRLGGHVFCLSAGRKGLDGKGGYFGLSLVMMEKGPGNDLVGFECGVRKLPHSRFMDWKYNKHVSLSFDEVTGKICSPDLFSFRWESFVDPDNLYCIEGMIYLKAVVTVW